ncbi:hypothetical protein SAMN05192583_2218 [Sphingomonas gellani]|uniref:Membrane-anchored ribosome-binding protein, inhibits growth in stationary phase, ElaB/YqjD/DUF883 family n=1 Tax=Sphingomonas gellani TaxID=1166340 RepID=A0A1H8EMC6_9SPHN|nr:hypothetical protein [Sphingomonas gellani]SEN20037.1 hypothetical protein SAMN05192583_2218 [Sphingomonas gellani]
MANTKTHTDTQHDHDHGRLHDVRETATHAYEATRDRTLDALESGRETAEKALAGIGSNPLAIVVGGLAVGAIAGSLIPRSAREKELLAPLGKQLGERARTAIDAAKAAGLEELNNRGLTRDGIRDQAKGLFDGVATAVSNAGTAAANASKQG